MVQEAGRHWGVTCGHGRTPGRGLSPLPPRIESRDMLPTCCIHICSLYTHVNTHAPHALYTHALLILNTCSLFLSLSLPLSLSLSLWCLNTHALHMLSKGPHMLFHHIHALSLSGDAKAAAVGACSASQRGGLLSVTHTHTHTFTTVPFT